MGAGLGALEHIHGGAATLSRQQDTTARWRFQAGQRTSISPQLATIVRKRCFGKRRRSTMLTAIMNLIGPAGLFVHWMRRAASPATSPRVLNVMER